jgi:uncharacterized protein (TIGR02598 family)
MKRSPDTRRGFSLVEVTLALGVAAFCLVTIFALLPGALNVQSASIGETGAAAVASMIEGDLRATPSGTVSSPELSILIGTTSTAYFSTEGEPSAAITAQSRYRATITFPANAAGARGATFATVTVSWPAAAALSQAAGRRSSFVALDRN